MADITGTPGDDDGISNPALIGTAGPDTIDGGDGNDLVEGLGGNDALAGGAGSDTVSYASAAALVRVNLALTTAQNTQGAGTDTLSGFENLTGSAFNDNLTGDGGANVLSGGQGGDTMVGAGGADTVYGGEGDDSLRGNDGNDGVYGGAGNDLLYGGAGDDYLDGGEGRNRVGFTVQDSDAQVGVTIDLNLQGAPQDTGHGMDTLIGFVNVLGTNYDDVLIGDDANNWLWGAGGGNDTYFGGGGDDLIEILVGENYIDGGSGIDTACFDSVYGGAVFIRLSDQGAPPEPGALATLVNIENVSGATRADWIEGDAGDNVLAGDWGADRLFGGDGNDVLLGDGSISVTSGFSGAITTLLDRGGNASAQDAADTLEGGNGDDVMVGGGFNDILHGLAGTGDVAVFSGAYADYEVIVGEGGQLRVTDLRPLSPEGVDSVDGVEILRFSDGDRTVAGLMPVPVSASDDVLQVTRGVTVTVDPAALLVNDTGLRAITGVSNAVGAAVALVNGQLVITASAASGSFDYTAQGQGGSATAHVTFSAVATSAGGNTVTAPAGVASAALYGQDGNDTLTGAGGLDHLVGGKGSDRLDGGLGEDVLDGGAGDDTYYVNSPGDVVLEDVDGGIDTVHASVDFSLIGTNLENVYIIGPAGHRATGNNNANRLYGGVGDDVLLDLNGDDRLFGGAGADQLLGGYGADQLDGGAGIDRMSGGADNDLYTVDDVADLVIENAGEGTDTVRALAASYTLGDNVETLTYIGAGDFVGMGNGEANSLTGGAGADDLAGLGGADRLLGLGGNDNLYGGEGKDQLDGGAGDDMMAGGAGDDTYVVDSLGDSLVELAGEGIDTVKATVSAYVLAAEVEVLQFAGAGDFAGAGNAGANTTVGGAGDDTLRGEGGADKLSGGAGDDALAGGAGADQLTGGLGADVFVFEGLGDFAAGETLMDFSHAQGDAIDLTGIDADAFTDGDQAFAFIGAAAFSGVAGQLRYSLAGSAVTVQGDIDGDGAADFSFRVAATAVLGADDFHP